MRTTHISEKELQRLLDLSNEERASDEAYSHVRSCAVCKKQLDRYEEMHLELHAYHPEPVDEVQVGHIMNRIRSKRTDSIMVPILQRFAYVVSLLLVLAVVGVIFYQFDVVDFSEFRLPTTEAMGMFSGIYAGIQNYVSAYSNSLTNFYDRLFGEQTFPVFTFTVVLLLILAVVDRLVFIPMLRRGR